MKKSNRTKILVMGVSGSGKSTIAKGLASYYKVPFIEADEFHSENNISKMKSSIPLTDEDRQPWLESIRNHLHDYGNNGYVLACSALKEKYRNILNDQKNLPGTTVLLNCKSEEILQRMKARDHFMPSTLLDSQYNDLEIPKNAIEVDCSHSIEKIISYITNEMDNKDQKSAVAEIGIVGLGVMGKSLARNIASKGYKVAVYNEALPGEEKVTEEFVATYPESDFFSGKDLQEFLQLQGKQKIILLMIKAGQPVDEMIDKLLPHLQKGDTIIDGGNSFYKDTIRRYQYCKSEGISFVGMGVSGGEEGALKGPSIMPAGDQSSKVTLLPILKSIAAVADGKPCVSWIGEDGSGHFVKMVHNGIEYADMQIISEIYSILKVVFEGDNLAIADYLEEWKSSMHDSYLLDITIDILRHESVEGKATLDQILDVAGHKGTGLWTVSSALELGVPIPTINAAMNQRILSSFKGLREHLSPIYVSNKLIIEKDQILSSLKGAALLIRLLALSEGFHLLNVAAKEYKWSYRMDEISQLWRGGCIIRSDMLLEIKKAFDENHQLDHLLASPVIQETVTPLFVDLKNLLVALPELGIATPAIHAAYNYMTSLTTSYLPVNLIQAQRDYFGAHTYKTLDDRETPQHTQWKK